MKLAMLLLSVTLVATAADYRLEMAPETTTIHWMLGGVVHTVHGTFKLKRGDVHFDPDTGKAAGEIVVDAGSGESGNGSRDSKMHKNVLESAKYKEISFVPDRVEGRVGLSGTSDVKLHGIFTVHGAAHEMTVPVQVIARQSELSANIRFEVPYVAWGMKDPSTFLLKVSKSVEIEVHTAGRLTTSARTSGN